MENCIIFPNVHEFVMRGVRGITDRSILEEWRNIGAGYGETSMFWEGDRKLLLVPVPIDLKYIEFIKQLVGYQEICQYSPERFTSKTSEDFLEDGVYDAVRQFNKGKDFVNFVPWGATEDLYRLMHELHNCSNNLLTDEIPCFDNYWSSLYYDSKMGFREVFNKIFKGYENVILTNGYSFSSQEEAMHLVRKYHKRRKPCVIKANNAVSGFGNFFVTSNLFDKPWEAVNAQINEYLSSTPYFKNGSVIVEEFIATPSPVECGNDFYHSCFMSAVTHPTQGTKLIASGVDMRDELNYYAGAYMGKGDIKQSIKAEIEQAMYLIGDQMSKDGFAGHWGANFMVDKQEKIYAIEINPRRCGESHIHGLAKKLYGENWMSELCIISRFPLSVELDKNSMMDIEVVLNFFNQINSQNSDALVVPTQLSWLKKNRYKGIGYVVFSKDREIVKYVDSMVIKKLPQIGIIPMI